MIRYNPLCNKDDIRYIRKKEVEMELAEEDDELKNIYAKIRELEFSIGTLGKILLTCQTPSTDFR